MSASASAAPNARAAPAAAFSSAALAALAFVTAVALVLRLWRVEQWSWSDAEASMWRAITQPLTGDGGLFAGEFRWSPLPALGLRWLFDSGLLPSHGEGWLRLPFAFFGAITVPLVAIVARRFASTPTALFAALLLAVHPGHVEASQTASPPVVAVAFALAAGAAWSRRAWWWFAFATVLAGACDAIGWISSAALVLGAFVPAGTGLRRALVPAVTLAGAVVARGLSWSAAGACLAAAAAPALAPVVAARLGLAAVLPLLLGAAGLVAVDAAEAAAAPALVALAAAVVMRASGLVGDALRDRTFVGVRAAAAAPALLVAGELLIGTFLYQVLYQGQRAPWRQAAHAVLTAVEPGRPLVVHAAEGLDVVTAYLRPAHWTLGGAERPGVALAPLPRDTDLDTAGAAVAVIVGADELEHARRFDQPWLAAFTIDRVFACARPGGDASVYLLRPRAR
jgi:hypothetical protein